MFPWDNWGINGKLLIDNLQEHNYYVFWTNNHQPQLNCYQCCKLELTNIEDNSCKTTIISAIDLLQTNPSFDGQSQPHICHRRSLLPFLGDALRWLIGTAATKDINSFKTQINQLIVTQSSQQETLVHVISY